MKTAVNFFPTFIMLTLLATSPSLALDEKSTAGSVRAAASQVPVDKSDPTKVRQAHSTAKAVNQIPGVEVQTKDLVPPSLPPIKGFHPIKKMLRPVENLEGSAIKMQQQIMKLEGPIAALHPPMENLDTKMGSVNGTMTKMQDQVNGVSGQMKGVRADLAKMQKDVAQLKEPILKIQKPLVGVTKPLDRVKTQLNYVLLAIILATFGVVVGTPLAAILVYKNRDKLFPKDVNAGLPQERQLTGSNR